MATRKTNEAVEAYRKVLRQELREEEVEADWQESIRALAATEFTEYARMTTDIDRAVDKVKEEAGASGWARSTRHQVIARAISGTGLDREGVR